MKKSKFTEEQIAFALKQAEFGTTVEEVRRKMRHLGCYVLQLAQEYGGLGPSELRRRASRTLRSRYKGPEREIYFAQEQVAGRLGLSDFTDARELGVQVGGQRLDHRLYQFVLAYSGWRHVEVMLGGESWVGLSAGLQNALWNLGGVPEEHRTDSLSAAFNNLAEGEALTVRYEGLCAGYGMRPSRNTPGASHENGAIEARQRTVKRFLEQALLLRASRVFATLDEYRNFVHEVVARANLRVARAVAVERAVLRPVPERRSSDYEQCDARVTKFGLISVRNVAYSVPSRLVGHRLKVRIYDDRIEAFLGEACVLRTARLRPGPGASRARQIDYRHMLAALKRKPGALVRWRLRESLFPRSEYALTWERLQARLPERAAARLMIGLLELAADGWEAALAARLAELAAVDELPDLGCLARQFAPRTPEVPTVAVRLPALASYDALVGAS